MAEDELKTETELEKKSRLGAEDAGIIGNEKNAFDFAEGEESEVKEGEVTSNISADFKSLQESSLEQLASEVRSEDRSKKGGLGGTIANSSAEKNSLGTVPQYMRVSEEQEILPLEEYIALFTKRYHEEEAFKQIVHNYLDIGSFKRIGWGIGKAFNKKWYAKKQEGVILTYATRIRNALEKAQLLKGDLARLEEEEKELLDAEKAAKEIKNVVKEKERDYAQAEEERRKKISFAHTLYSGKQEKEKELLAKRSEEIRIRTNAAAIVKETLQEHLKRSELIKVEDDGTLSFDENLIANRLEDIFLDEIVEEIERDDGAGFLSKVMSTFGGVIAYFAPVEDLSEIPNIDWVQSIIYSRTKGYDKPQFPFFVAGKGEDRAKTSIDTALALDVSGSMRNNDRYGVAKKTTLALRALMRKTNPLNETILACFNDSLHETTSAELMKKNYCDGGTATDKALNWLLDTLKDKGPSIAYLVTDGYPESGEGNILNRCIDAAKRFTQYPYVKLRIFLIDGDSESKRIVKLIGEAAGPGTKFVPVQNYQLASGIIKDVNSAIGEMYSLTEW